jgi:D-alanine-D-alanine ligase
LPEVGVIFGGPSPEHDVSILTGLQAVRCLSDGGYPVHALFWSKTGQWFEVDARLEATDFTEGVPKGATALELVVGPGGGFQVAGRSLRARRVPLEVVLVCCHGGPGEDGSLQAVLDLIGIPYTGPSAAGAALGMDKLAFGALVSNAGLPTLPRTLLPADPSGLNFAAPFIVKPRFGGSSIGIEVVSDFEAATELMKSSVHLSRWAVVEPYLSDSFDLQIAVSAWPRLRLSAIERPLRRAPESSSSSGTDILDYRDKYAGGEGMASAPRELPAQISMQLAEDVRRLAMRVSELIGLRGTARVDYLSDGKDLWLNEINSIPGSLAKYLWIDPAIPFLDQLRGFLDEAIERGPLRHSAAGADGTILYGASSIAAKLA